jgi:hypothetical protein
MEERKMENRLIKVRIDPFSPVNFVYTRDEDDKALSCVDLNNAITKKPPPEFNQKTVYHFTNKGKEIIDSGIFRFYWQMRNNEQVPDEVLSKYCFTEANRNPDGSLVWQTHGTQWNSFSLAQVTRTVCFFTGKIGSHDADLMKEKFGKNVLKVNFTEFKKDVKTYCVNNNKILFVNKVKYVKSVPKNCYPLPVLGKTIGEVGLEVSAIIKNLMKDRTCFNKTQEHKFEHELRFIFFDEYATLDEDTEYIDVPISKDSMVLL